MNKRRLPPETEPLIDQLLEILPAENDALKSFLANTYTPGRNWLEAFAEHIGHLFRGMGLLLFNAGAPAVKSESRPFFKQLIADNTRFTDAFKQSTDNVLNSGYPAQVHFQPGHSYIFLSESGGARRHLLVDGNQFTAKDKAFHYSAEALSECLKQHPDWFSSTVLTRPLWQSWLLPTVSYIGGAAEVRYWAQTTRAFETLGLQMPCVQLRRSVTLLEPRIQRLLQKYDLMPDTIDANRDTFIRQTIKKMDSGGFNPLFEQLSLQMNDAREKILHRTNALDPTLQGPAEKTFRSVSANLEKLQNRLIRRMEEKDAQTHNQLERLHRALFPAGKLQERVISPIYFESRYPGWLARLRQSMEENKTQHIFFNI